jgi:guanine deaminase
MSTTARVTDAEWLTRAVRLATDSVSQGGGPFGALIVRGDGELATGTNQVTSSFDPTGHAEIVAIRRACASLGDFRLNGCVLVSSCEPCPMCLAAALWARVDRVIFAADRNDAQSAGFDDKSFYELFEQPRDSWPVTVTQLSIGDRNRPFRDWLASPDRVEY